jgi:hypothetical protein
VQAALEHVGSDLAACNAQVETLHRQQIEALAALGTVDGEALAADAEQQATDAAARLSTLVADYAARPRPSSPRRSTTYQQRYQGPLLARGVGTVRTDYWRALCAVATDFSDEMTILVGVRPNGKRENVGNLSSGNRDQLFLALRLAAIERHVVVSRADAGGGRRHRDQFRRCVGSATFGAAPSCRKRRCSSSRTTNTCSNGRPA